MNLIDKFYSPFSSSSVNFFTISFFISSGINLIKSTLVFNKFFNFSSQCSSIEVHRHALIIVRLQILHVDLSRNALIAVAHRRGTLRHLDTVHPRPRNIIQGIWGCRSAEVGEVFCEHLHIGSAQSQESDLFCSCSSITVVDIY